MHVRNTCEGWVGGAQKSKESVVEHPVSFRQCIRCRWLTFRSKVTFWLFFQYHAATCVVAIVEQAASGSLTVLFVFATMFVTVKLAGLWLLTLPHPLFLMAMAALLPSIRDRGGSGSSKRAVLTDAHLRSVWTNNRLIPCQSSGEELREGGGYVRIGWADDQSLGSSEAMQPV